MEQIGDLSHENKIVNAAGNAVPGAPNVNVLAGLTHVAWISPVRVFGGWYGAEVVATEVHINAGQGAQAGGWGAVIVSPFILQWPKYRWFGIPVYQRFTSDFILPSGKYNPTAGANPGNNAWGANPYYSITVLPKKRIETSWRVHYLWNSVNHDPLASLGAKTSQAGQAIHFNATAAYDVYKGLWVGANAYHLSQITAPGINGVALHNSPEQVSAVGPGMVWQLDKWFLWADTYQEFNVENRGEGRKLVLRITKVF